MKQISLIFLLLMITISAKSQNKLGFEIRTSRNVTYNASNLSGGSFGISSYRITKEENTNTTSYSFGVLYKPNVRTTLRLHIGKHKNGRILDLTSRDDVSMSQDYENINRPYKFVQITPSISYNIINQKIKMPLEFGLSINKRTNIEDIFFVFIKKYNYDLRISSGLQYDLGNMNFGMNVVYSKSISEYQDIYEFGKYEPYQIGLEFVISYLFK